MNIVLQSVCPIFEVSQMKRKHTSFEWETCNCEHIIQPVFPLKTCFFKFILIFSDKNHSKFNSSRLSHLMF
jgi:hypothetical protein